MIESINVLAVPLLTHNLWEDATGLMLDHVTINSLVNYHITENQVSVYYFDVLMAHAFC